MIIETIGVIAAVTTINDKLRITDKVKSIKLHGKHYIEIGHIRTINNQLAVY